MPTDLTPRMDATITPEHLREKRKAKGMSQRDLAAELGLYQSRISYLENGSVENPTVITQMKILEFVAEVER